MSKQVWVIVRKEITDHFRERRSVLASLMHLLMGPCIVFLISFSGVFRGNAKAAPVLAAMTSIFTLVSTFVGGMNVAMDAIAGERERRSLVPLLLNPVSRSEIVIGKWLAVCLFSLGGLAVTLAGFALAGIFVGAPNPLFSKTAFLCWVFLGLAPLAIFAAALQIGISAMCRTTKEAHTYLSLLIFVPMAIAMFLVFFMKRAGLWAAFVPIAGQQAIVEAGLNANHWPLPQAITLGLVTLWCAALTVAIAGRLLERDDVVYGS